MMALRARLMKVREFAEALKIESDTVYRWISRKKIEVVRIKGTRALRIPSTELDRLTSVTELDAAAPDQRTA
jgi:excisionase family DNA binding protein